MDNFNRNKMNNFNRGKMNNFDEDQMGFFKLDKDQKDKLLKFSNMTTSFMFKAMGWFGRVVNFWTKNTKLLFGLILLVIFFKVGTYVVAYEPSGVYEITTSTGVVYNTNEIQVIDGCVHFKQMNTQEETIICGGCTVVKNN
jgi:hypothetical protein